MNKERLTEERLTAIADEGSIEYDFCTVNQVLRVYFKVNGCRWKAQSSVDIAGFYAVGCEEPRKFFEDK